MAKSLLYTVNNSVQALLENGKINLGSTVRRFGCNCVLSGDSSINVNGEGYYEFKANVIVEPTAIGTVTVTLYDGGNAIQGAVGSVYASTASEAITIPILAVIRKMCCSEASNLYLVINSAGNVTNVVTTTEKL